MKKVSTATWVARIFGAAILLLLWIGAFVSIADWTDDHYQNMNDGNDTVNFIGLILLTVAGLGIVGWYDLEQMITDARGRNNQAPIKTMYIKIGQFVLGAIGLLLMAA